MAVWLPSWAHAVAPEDYYNAGMDLYNNHDYQKAIQYFHAAVDERPDYWQAYQSLGNAYYQNGNVTAALMAMERSLKLHSDNKKLKEFVSKIKNDSPWASNRWSSSFLPVFALILSLLSAGWTAYWTWRCKPFLRYPPSNP